VGVFLSGGIDSSTIAAFSKVKNFSSYAIGLHKEDPELLRARKIAKLFKSNHDEIIFDKESFRDVETLIGYLGEPLNLLPALHLYRLSQEARKKLKVMISGNGADEIFYGYNGSNRIAALSYLLKFPFLKPFLKGFLLFGSTDINEIKANIYRAKGNEFKQELYQPSVIKELDGFDEGAIVEGYMRECDSDEYIEKSYYAGFMSENQHSITIITDLAGMMNSLEIRAPFLDHKMVEFAAALPVRLKVKSWFQKKYNKYIMKKSMEEILPQDILYAKKMGLGYHIRIDELIRHEWQEEVKKILFEVLPKAGLFNVDFIRRKFDEHLANKKNNSPLLWGLTVFGVWYKKFLQ